MDDGLLSLKWNNHKTTFFEILKVLRDKANYTDATLAVDGKFYPVHKLVLSTCSEYFSEIFERTPCKSPVIVLKDVRSQDLESLLDYMYLGEVNVNQNDLALLLKTAECLRIKGLAVPDEDPTTRHSNISTPVSKSHASSNDDISKEAPPAKRRKEDSATPLSPQKILPSTRPSLSPSHTSSHTINKSTPESCSPGQQGVDPPLVKVEVDDDNEGDEAFQSDNYDSNPENDVRDFTVEKSDHDPSSYPNNFSLGSSQQSAEVSWEDGENSFPQDAFGNSSGQQAGVERVADFEPMGLVQVELSPGGGGDDEYEDMTKALTNLDDADLLAMGAPITNPLAPPGTETGTGQGDYSCMFCGKVFFYPSSLEKHIRTHTGERPFKCSRCDYGAAQKSHLKTHMVRKHNTTLANDEEATKAC